ncbi:hypothetical protein AMK22_15520 [Streptomyces sp. CB01580]|nr:hypothetical protein AMK22_15520 [Streptomyces sp. CB01580]
MAGPAAADTVMTGPATADTVTAGPDEACRTWRDRPVPGPGHRPPAPRTRLRAPASGFRFSPPK